MTAAKVKTNDVCGSKERVAERRRAHSLRNESDMEGEAVEKIYAPVCTAHDGEVHSRAEALDDRAEGRKIFDGALIMLRTLRHERSQAPAVLAF